MIPGTRIFPRFFAGSFLPAYTKSDDAYKRCTERAGINDEYLDTMLGTLRIDAFNVMSGNGRRVPII